jgi:hypothetical protein
VIALIKIAGVIEGRLVADRRSAPRMPQLIVESEQVFECVIGQVAPGNAAQQQAVVLRVDIIADDGVSNTMMTAIAARRTRSMVPDQASSRA